MVGSSNGGTAESGDEYYRKTRPTAITERERQNARRNIDRYEWTAAMHDAHVENVGVILDCRSKIAETRMPHVFGVSIPSGWVSVSVSTDGVSSTVCLRFGR